MKIRQLIFEIATTRKDTVFSTKLILGHFKSEATDIVGFITKIHMKYSLCQKTTGKPIKWIICFSPVLRR